MKSEGERWDAAYKRGGNICFYPHEEIIRFINKFVRKRDGIDEFRNIMQLADNEWIGFKSLDLGCGMGRHVKFLDEFNLNPYGIDLSDTAVNLGKRWFESIGRSDLCDRLIVGSVDALPFDNDSFNICVSHGVLDSMPRDIAKAGFREAIRVLRGGGLMYFDLVMDSKRGDIDEIVDSGYEKDTTQSYFTIESIHELIEGTFVQIKELKTIEWKDEEGNVCVKRAHIIVEKKCRA